MAALLGVPAAILVISAHWEESKPTLTAGSNPPLLYDYYGFPRSAYEIQYPAPGQPDLAGEIAGLLGQNGINAEQGLD